MHQTAIQLLFDNIHALPHDEYGVINFLPFTHDSEQVRAVKRHMCEAIVGLLDSHGYIQSEQPPAAAQQSLSRVTVKCIAGNCDSEMLLSLPVSTSGIARVNAAQFIQSVSQLNPQCPHSALTLEDMRAHMEQEFWASTCIECSAETSELTDGRCEQCNKAKQERMQ